MLPLFVLSSDQLLCRVRSHTGVHVLPLPGTGVVEVSACAGDLTLFVADRDKIVDFPRVYTAYSAFSGSRLSSEKTQVMFCRGYACSMPPGFRTARNTSILGIQCDCYGVTPPYEDR